MIFLPEVGVLALHSVESHHSPHSLPGWLLLRALKAFEVLEEGLSFAVNLIGQLGRERKLASVSFSLPACCFLTAVYQAGMPRMKNIGHRESCKLQKPTARSRLAHFFGSACVSFELILSFF